MKSQLSHSVPRAVRALAGLTIAAGLSLAPVWGQQVEPAAPETPAPPPGAPAPLTPPPVAPGAPMLGMMPPGAMMGGLPAGAVAANGDNVYVVRGNMVYRLRASDLTELAHAMLPLTAVAGASGTALPPGTVTPPSGEAAAPAAPPAPEANAPAAPPAPEAPAPPVGMAPGGMMPFGGQPASIAAAGTNVYVLHGNTLYELRARDLSLISTHELPPPGATDLTTPPATPLTNPPGATAPRGRRSRRGTRGLAVPPSAAPGGAEAPSTQTF